MSTKLYVIGIGYKPFDKRARQITLNSEIILASSRLFEIFKGYEEFEKVKEKVKVITNVDKTINFIKSKLQTPHSPAPLREAGRAKLRTIVLLASGDPMFFGIGKRIVNEFGKNKAEILPDLSSVQAAFSKIKTPWSDAFFISLHGGPNPKKRRKLEYEIRDIPLLLEKHNKIAILTDKVNNPSVIAKVLTSKLKMYVCEKLGYPDEKITRGTPEKIAEMSFRDPNIVILRNIPPTLPSPLREEGEERGKVLASDLKFGLKESEFSHSRGLITKDEVRASTIHKLRLPQKGVFWDIGAGSGSVSIESAKLCPGLKIFAVERDKKQTENIRKNLKKFKIINIKIINGEAPLALRNLPAPDRVFIGGSGGRLKEVIDFIAKTPVKIIIINAVTIETLNLALTCLEKKGFKVETSEVSISRTKIIGEKKHMNALNPVFIITGER
ncbi:MAG: precorrin-6y C5,15-methyltransferase (decarboxylating) subunit CbiE [Nitrospirae bacterium]|nr:precorrin-6y C5,15-methyltransferase (decarboxylating) subunit CbiE [Nitrospirota bacterium]